MKDLRLRMEGWFGRMEKTDVALECLVVRRWDLEAPLIRPLPLLVCLGNKVEGGHSNGEGST